MSDSARNVRWPPSDPRPPPDGAPRSDYSITDIVLTPFLIVIEMGP